MRRRLRSSAACGLFLISLSLGGAGCSKKESEKPAEGAERSRTGVGDVVDYLTGKTPLEIKKRAEEKLDRITRERDKRLRELLDAGAAPAPKSPASQPPGEEEP